MSPEQPGGQPPQRARREGRYGIVIARPFGVPVYISPYWFLVAALVVVFYAGSLPDSIHPSAVRYAVAATFVVLLYASVLVHELSHCVVARAFGLTVRRILLWPLGGFSEIEQEPQTPAREFAVSAVGPVTSLALAGLGFAVITLVDLGGIPRELIDQLILANLVVGVFNLLPGLPLDGGRMLRAGVWQITKRPGQATIAAAWGGRVLAVLMVVVPVAVLGSKLSLTNTWLLWLAFIAVFMWISSGQAIRAAKVRDRLPGLQARRLARRAIAIPGNVPLSEAIRQADEAQARALVVIDHDSTPIAIVNETAVMATPPQRRPWIEVGSLARAIEPGIVLSADLSGIDLIEAVQRAPATEYLLIEPSGQVFGVLATTDLDHAFAGV
ncbi:MAG TPA: site-2 protease family protein [Streptosporangiaceae bacterium]|jgi:Zn-dependent protease|nr:site-2 protease family protein [Streptosporangiaceae bacterium]